jgi:large subunit ribosomal protein L3
MAGRMGSARFTVQNLSIQAIDPENNLLLVRGAIPGPAGALVLVRTAAKATKKGGAK